ncbi:MAG: hypothetical protein M3O70_02810 [Actinomycetota bacterium]|nr:hypothetical protein [Actinomycetota bacterium]
MPHAVVADAAANPAFDVTPAALVSALVTEKGVVEQPNGERLAAHLAAEVWQRP